MVYVYICVCIYVNIYIYITLEIFRICVGYFICLLPTDDAWDALNMSWGCETAKTWMPPTIKKQHGLTNNQQQQPTTMTNTD